MFVQRQLIAVRLPGHLLKPQFGVGRTGGHQGRLERRRSSRLEPPGLGLPPGSVLLPLEVGQEAAAGGPVLVGGAVPRGVGVVSSSSTLNKAKLQYRNLILLKILM